MKIVIAPDSLKESLPAARAAEAIAEGVLQAWPAATVDLCPLADGGEGTVDAMVAATGGQFHTADVFDPLGAPIRAKFGLLGKHRGDALPGDVGLLVCQASADGQAATGGSRMAVVEMAAASGLERIRPDRRDPLRTTTYGTGQLLLAAVDAGAREIILGIGGSATVDAGAGCLQALGVEFYDAAGEALRQGMGGGSLPDIADIETSGLDPRLGGVNIRVACDVTNPLTGEQGAARVYGPQKGASPECVEHLEVGLCHFASLLREQLGVDIETLPGAGAAGGLGAGLVAVVGANLEPGAKLLAGAVDLPRRLRGADLCITAEGRLDAQSASGKLPVRVADMAGAGGVSTICLAGQVSPDAPRQRFADVRSLVGEDIPLSAAMADPAAALRLRAAEAIRAFLAR